MKDDKLRDILAGVIVNYWMQEKHWKASEVAELTVTKLGEQGYVIISKQHFRDAVETASRRIAEAFATMVPPPERKQ